jgi:tRNA modification GTPase
MKNKMLDTIVAPATNISTQAISIIRLSGQDSFKIINSFLKKDIPHESGTHLRNFFNHADTLIDQVFLISFVNPNSFTGEDVIEINCHGGVLVTKKIIELLISAGARMAERGEFSRRAFLNQKISLIQAQGINDLIESKNELALRVSAKNMSGRTNVQIEKIKREIIDVISMIQTAIDYPEYEETDNVTPENIRDEIDNLNLRIKNLISISKRVSTFKEGIKTAIIGIPNVGKSSLLNALLNEDKAIVSDIQGTTRDVVEGEISFDNFNLHLLDTAGIRNTSDKLEKLGIEKSIKIAAEADLILYLLNAEEDINNLIEVDKNKTIYIVNKSDEFNENQIAEIKERFQEVNPIFISAINGEIDNLIQKIESKFNLDELIKLDSIVLTNTAEIARLIIVDEKINLALNNINNGFSIDLVNIDLRAALEELNELLGLNEIEEEIIDNIFKKYCLGK